ncbi:hypothetical protein BH11MYX1_BH11MYX1_46050 [soil metagenome]
MTAGVTRPAGTTRGRAIRRFRVSAVAGPSRGAQWDARGERCAIGSHPSNDLVLDDNTVSRFHCELAISGGTVRVRELGSRNGTTAGAIRIVDASVSGGAVLVLGNSQLEIRVDDDVTEVAASPRTSFGAIIGASEPMREVFSQLEKIAASDATVLVEGETGTGKEGVAEAIHEASARRAGPFVVVDCSAITASLLESELFGHEAGAFTGAIDRRIGAFEQAAGGTVFLDEIGELPAELQPKLLRVLEAREVRRVGGKQPIRCDLRIVAATNRDLRGEVNRGSFRADLYYRLAVIRLALPPLRERHGDIPLLVDQLLRRLHAPEATRQLLMTSDYLAELAAAPWSGNVRELRNHLEQCVVFGERRAPGVEAAPMPRPHGVDATIPYEIARKHAIDDFERAYVTALLALSDGNVAKAAREAGVNRAYLHRLLSRHGLR